MRIILSLMLSCAFLLSCQQNKQETNDPEILAEIEAVENGLRSPVSFEGNPFWTIEERMNHYGVPGVSIAVIKDFKVHWSKTYGIVDRDTEKPVVENTLFQAGSISKPVAAMAMLRQVQEGKLDLETEINTYLKSWQLPDNEHQESEKVTLGRIVSHTAGLTIHGFPGYARTEEVPSIVQVLDAAGPTNTGKIRVDMPPGSQYRYSGGGYCIMQLLLEDVSGLSFPDLTKQTVLDPLGMTHSSYAQPLPDSWQANTATGYLPDGSKVEGQWHIYPEMAAAGLWTTARDLAQAFIELQKGVAGEETKVLEPDMAQQMLKPYFEDFVGLGMFLENNGEEWYFSHGGWDEGFSSEAIAHKTRGYGVVILTNSNHPPFISELIRSVAATYQWDERQAPIYKAEEVSEDELARVEGRYQYDEDQHIEIFQEDDQLFFKYLKDKLPIPLTKIGDNEYIRPTRTNIIQFLEDPETGVQHLVFREEGSEKLTFDNPRMQAADKVPFQYFVDEDYEGGLKAYQALQQQQPDSRWVQEGTLNSFGYELMGNDQIDLAISIFRLNVALYPNSSNVYDSLGEAYLNNGDKALAAKNYQKSLQLDPKNTNALKVLKELGVMSSS